jgi:hypothetical protein
MAHTHARTNFVTELKSTNPGEWYKIAKQIGAVDKTNSGDIFVESLEGLSNENCAQTIAQHFASVSNEYLPVDHAKLPSYLPATKPLQVSELDIYDQTDQTEKNKVNSASGLT